MKNTGKQLFSLSGILHFFEGPHFFFHAVIFKYTKLPNHYKICSKLRSQVSVFQDSVKLILVILRRILFQFTLQILKRMPVIILHSLFQAISFRYILCNRLSLHILSKVLFNKHLLLSTCCGNGYKNEENLTVVISKANFKIINRFLRKEINF